MITGDDFERYSRQMMMPEIGIEGQQKLKSAKVLIAGTGGLGSAAALYLTAAGVGTLGLADADCVDKSNLHRQIIFSDSDVGKPKTETAKKNLLAINPNVKINIHGKVDENVASVIKDYDIVIDCTDNFDARYAISDAAIAQKRHNVYASVVRFEGQLTVFAPGGPCFRCLNPMPPAGVQTCSEVGIFGALVGMMGTMQAMEAIKIVVGQGEVLTGKLMTFDALKNEVKYLKLPKRVGCICQRKP